MKHPLILLTLSATLLARAGTPMPISSLWESDSFRKAFTASYGIDAPAEPRISLEEKKVLDSIAEKMKKGNRTAAIVKLQESVWLKQSPALHFSLGNLLVEEGCTAEAIAQFMAALKLHPYFRDAHRNLALAQIQEGEMEAAFPSLARAIELGARDGLTLGLLGYCHSAAEHHTSALQAYREAQRVMPDEWQWKLGEAYALLALGEARKAADLYAELIDGQPENDMLWLGQSDAWMLLDQNEKAIANREHVRRKGQLQGDNLIVLGHLYLNESLPGLATDCYLEALDAGVDPTRSLEALERLMAARHWKESRTVAAAIGTVPPAFQTRLDRAVALLELESGNMEAGERAVKRILERDPLDTDAMILLARAYRKTARYEEAAMLLEQAANQPESEVRALRLLGQIHAEQGQFENALTALNRAYDLEPSRGLQEYINAIRSILKTQKGP